MPEISLRVQEALPSDVGSGRARIGSGARDILEVIPGDIVEIRGPIKKTTATVWRGYPDDEKKDIIRIDGITRRNCSVSIDDRVKVLKAEVKNAERVVLAPIHTEKGKVKYVDGFANVIRRSSLNRPLIQDDIIPIIGFTISGVLYFSVISTTPKGIVKITERTEIVLKEETVTELEVVAKKISYEDIGGLKDELQKVREMIELPLKHPELFERLGITPPKGVLLHGPPGTGKTLIAKAVANESKANFLVVNGPEIMSKYYGESEARVREIFEKAEKNSPSIIFIDEIDSIAPKREDVQGEVERRVVAQLLTLMDGLKARGKIIVIGATNRVDAIDPALRRPGRFDREIELRVPDRNGRKEILQIHTRGMPIEGDEKRREEILNHFADITHGFVGADLSALARESAMKTLRRYLPEIDLDKQIPIEILEKMVVTIDDFRNALKDVEPSALREILIDIPKITWQDIGGLESVKQLLKETVEWPIKNPELFEKLGITPPRGVLLYGPPGTGKTLLAKAIANESQANFISIKGPEVMSKWVGESEKAVREIFKKAKQSAPSIIFLDEIDSIAPRREISSESDVTERVVNQLLTSMDGIESLEGVVVIGATNRPDIVDPALLRPGRFDRLILTSPPDKKARLEIFKVHTKKMPLVQVSLEELAEKTEGFTGADIQALCRESAIIVMRENLFASKVAKEHFLKAMEVIKPSIDKETMEYYMKIGKQLEREKVRRREDVHYL